MTTATKPPTEEQRRLWHIGALHDLEHDPHGNPTGICTECGFSWPCATVLLTDLEVPLPPDQA